MLAVAGRIGLHVGDVAARHFQSHQKQQDAAGDPEGRHRDSEEPQQRQAGQEEEAEKKEGEDRDIDRDAPPRRRGAPSVAAANSGTLPTGSMRANRATKKLTAKAAWLILAA